MLVPEPILGDGKICYLEIPAPEPEVLATFYQKVFNWNIRQRGDGEISFDDVTGQVSGMFSTRRKPGGDPGVLIYIMVFNAEKAMLKIVEHGGTILQQIGADLPEITAQFADPAGNVFGIHQEPPQA